MRGKCFVVYPSGLDVEDGYNARPSKDAYRLSLANVEDLRERMGP
jgi:hypothetical protein